MKNIRLLIEYDGAPFAGWQRQATKPTVQATIEDVLSKVERRRVVVYGASRTDSGVHAEGQVANFHTPSPMPPEKWRDILNFYLPREIRIRAACEADPSFHAQKRAVSKLYVYRVLNRRFASALDRRASFYPGLLEWDKIRMGLPHFVGEKDFRGFQGAKAEVKTTVRRISRFELFEEGDGFYRFEIEGNGFLKQMVRSIVGTVLELGELRNGSGEQRRRVESIDAIFATGDRTLAGRTAPPTGLCLARIHYEEE